MVQAEAKLNVFAGTIKINSVQLAFIVSGNAGFTIELKDSGTGLALSAGVDGLTISMNKFKFRK